MGQKIRRVQIDTNVILRLHELGINGFNLAARDLLLTSEIFVSHLVELELQTLFEKNKVLVLPSELIGFFQDNIGLQFSRSKVNQIVKSASSLKWTRDPFDRLIVGNALANEMELLTSDRNILENFSLAVSAI